MQIRPTPAPTRRYRPALTRRSLPGVLLALLLCALWVQAQHVHTTALPDHADCAVCKIGNADPANAHAPMDITFTLRHVVMASPALPPRAAQPLQVRNRAPPITAPNTI